MGRPTISDLAKAAEVSVSTINRVIGGGHKVRSATMRHVKDAAEAIGFYRFGSIKSRLDAARQKYRFGILLQQPTRTFYKMLAQALKLGPLNAALWRLRRRGRGFWVISLDFTCVWTHRVGSGLEPEFGVGRVWG